MSDDTATATETNDAPPPNIFSKIDNPIVCSQDEDSVRVATSEQRKRREESWERGEISDDVFAEQRAPVIERKWGYPGDIKLKDAQLATSEVHKAEHGERVLRAFGRQNPSLEDSRATGDELAGVGYKPSQTDHVPIGVADNQGRVWAPLDDGLPIPERGTGNVREVTKAQSNFRQVLAAEQAQLLQELQAQEEQKLPNSSSRHCRPLSHSLHSSSNRNRSHNSPPKRTSSASALNLIGAWLLS